MMHYISTHVHYPKTAREQGQQGTVVVQFEIGVDGSLQHVETVGAQPSTALGDEAVRIVKGMPAWHPGIQDGHKVVVRYSLPIRFVLQ